MMASPQLQEASIPSAATADLPYEEVVGRIPALVEELTPVGAIVLVVSKGDEDLVRLEGRAGWHFPRAGTGQYAGHHPPDGGWAVEHVEALRAAGGAYLVLPATYFWWLEHYPELDQHLRTHYERLPCEEEVCRVYRLLDTPALPPRPLVDLLDGGEQRRALPAMRSLVSNLLPEEEIVLVVSAGDGALLDLGQVAWHFPHDSSGGHVPLEAIAGHRAVTQLRTLRQRGIRYLLVPAARLSSLLRSPALADYLDRECRRLALRSRICVLYELRSSARTSTPIALGAKEAVQR
jgi:hypothetical protein